MLGMKTRSWTEMVCAVLGPEGTAERRAKYRKVCEQIEALPAKEARLLEKIEDMVGYPVKHWPDAERTRMLGKHLDFRARFGLYLFVVGNMCPPGIFVDWIVLRGMLRDQAAAMHMITILKSHMTGKLEQEGKTYWDLHARKVMTMITPTFAFDTDPMILPPLEENGKPETVPPGASYWQDAIAELEDLRLSGKLPRD